jgi:hypothetical protein
MKSLHIISSKTLEKHKFNLGPCHWIDLSNGHLIVHEATESARLALENEEGTIAMPHLLDGSPIKEIAKRIGMGVKPTDSAFVVSAKIGQVHSAFTPTQF